MGIGWVYPNPSGTEMRFDFSSPLGMGRVTGKYMSVGYRDKEGKTRPHPAPLPCLDLSMTHLKKFIDMSLAYYLSYVIFKVYSGLFKGLMKPESLFYIMV